MLEIILGVVLMPVALAAIVFVGCFAIGVVKAIVKAFKKV